MDFKLSRTHRQQLLVWAQAADPHECCGLLLGDNGVVERVELTTNAAADPRAQFEIEPAALIAAERAARQGGPAILGYFHSHPNGAAIPSATDARMALADGRIWLIVANGDVTAWRPHSDDLGLVNFVAQAIVWG